jgi:hypothetical protein
MSIDRSVLAAALAAVMAGSPSAQSPTRVSPRPLPRTPWGHPDLQGRWTSATLTPLERPSDLGPKEYFTEAEASEYAKTALERFVAAINMPEEAALAGEFSPDLWGEPRSIVPTRRTSLIVGSTGRLPPLTAEGRQRAAARAAARKADRADSPEERPLPERCLWFPVEGPPMLPGIVYNSNYEIVQTPTHVAIHVEMGDGVRIIPLDGRPHLPAHVAQWFGDSRGRWEGDTLVVETTNFSDKRDFRGSTDRLRLIERFKRTSQDLLLYEFTAEDPTTWSAPWTAEIPMQPLGGLLYEYACHEGNRSLGNILRAARAADAAANR